MRRRLAIALVFLLTGLSGILHRATWAGSVPGLDPDRVRWAELVFRAKHLLVAVSIHVRLRALAGSEFEELAIASSRSVPVSHGSEVYHLLVHSTIDPLFRSAVELSNQVWFDPNDGTAFQRIRMERGEDYYKKTYRFNREGVYRRSKTPKNREETELDPEQWSDFKETFYPYDLDESKCLVVSEASVIAYIGSAASHAKGTDPVSVCVFGKRQLHRVRLRFEGPQPLETDYLERTAREEVSRKREVDAIKILLDAQPMHPDPKEAEDFSFLGLKNDVAIFVDAVSGIPLRISGGIPGVGKAVLKLHEVRLRDEADQVLLRNPR